MTPLSAELEALLAQEPVPLVTAALLISRIELPNLASGRILDHLGQLGARASTRLARCEGASTRSRIDALNALLYDEEGFTGDAAPYDDVRSHLLPGVLERRRGIPISLATVYLSVARQAGLEVFGVSFPGHFLLRVPDDAGRETAGAVILDPLHRGRELDAVALGVLYGRYASAGVAFDSSLLLPCTSRQIVVRMLANLKRLYVSMRSFPHAWAVTDLLVTAAGQRPEDLRDRGLLAYRLEDYPAALADLEAYLRFPPAADDDREERDRIWEHVSTLRRRVASLN